jgi:hypothetical protein
MTSAPILVACALFAVLVGAALPVLYQLYQTLKRARAVLDTAGPHLEKTLDRVGQAAERLDRIGARLEGPAQSLGPVLAAATRVGDSIGGSGSWLRTAASIGGALAPAVIAGVSALFLKTELRSGSDGNQAGDDAREHAAGH